MQTLKQIAADFYNWHAMPTRLRNGRVKEAVTAPSEESAYDRFIDNVAVAFTYSTNRRVVVQRAETKRTFQQALTHQPHTLPVGKPLRK